MRCSEFSFMTFTWIVKAPSHRRQARASVATHTFVPSCLEGKFCCWDGASVQHRLASNLLHRQNWPQTPGPPASTSLVPAGIKGRGHNAYLRWRFDSFQGPATGLASAATGLWSWDAPGRGAIVEISSHTFLPSIFLATTFSQGHLLALHFSIGPQGQNFSFGLKESTSLVRHFWWSIVMEHRREGNKISLHGTGLHAYYHLLVASLTAKGMGV